MFRPGRSTVHAVEEVRKEVTGGASKWLEIMTLNIRNVFNTASLDLIRAEKKKEVSPKCEKLSTRQQIDKLNAVPQWLLLLLLLTTGY